MNDLWNKFKTFIKDPKGRVFKITSFLIIVVALCYFGLQSPQPQPTPVETPPVVEENKVNEEYLELKEKNSDFYGWITIDGTSIDFPVVYKDNEYYLTHNFELEDDPYGIPFIDIKCNIEERSTNLLIHGHSTLSGPIGRMFDDLVNYRDQSFYEEHKNIKFNTMDEEATYEIIMVIESRVMYKDETNYRYYNFIDVANEEELNSNIEELKKLSLYDTGVEVEYGDQFITLSTCDPTRENGRLAIVAKKIEK